MRAVAFSILLLATVALAQPKHPYDDALESLKQRNAAEHAAPANADRKVWDYVIADKKAGTVTVMAFASVIKPTDPVEFFVCTTDSGKDYESLAVTPARPSDIKAAMQFIGLKPGLPIGPEKNRYWPRGQRITLTFDIGSKPTRAEDLVQDTNTKAPLARSGLVFTGSYDRTDDEGKTTLAADVLDAKPIAPLYNDPAALLDVPRQATQSVVYGFQKPSAAFTFKAGEVVNLTFAAASGEDAVAEGSLTVAVGRAAGKTTYVIKDVAGAIGPHDLARREKELPRPVGDLPVLIVLIEKLSTGPVELFTRVTVDPAVPVSDVAALYGVLQSIENGRGVKLDPPADGELFHRAFFPKPEWRDRSTRLGEPWELFLSRGPDAKLVAKLERAVDNPDRADGTPKFVVESTVPPDPAAFVKTVNDNASRWSKAIFVYPPADLTYGELMDWVRPVLATYPRVFVFPTDEAGEKPATRPAATRTLDAK